ncbi:hypothetical protein R3P38DRAFT_2636214 [Favolaschia claudopus]|uniref:MYND-type domain-containing protein n=1 Tax=Favolaschia claudopus TaxID=2862362 RepID=A0AAW0ASX3_9AGAR
MHCALRPTNIGRLPTIPRTALSRVYGPNPSPFDIKRAILQLQNHRNSDSAGLLSAYYRLLDPARIPTAGELDGSIHTTIPLLHLVLLVLDAVFTCNAPPRSARDLWPRISVWVQFFQLFGQFLAPFDLGWHSELHFCRCFLAFTQDMCTYAPNTHLITSTPGFAGIATRAWVLLMRTRDISVLEAGLHNGLALLLEASATEEIVEEAEDLASLVAAHLQLVAPDAHSHLSEVQVELLHYVLSFWHAIAIQKRPNRRPMDPVSVKLMSTNFFTADVVRGLTIAFGAAAVTVADTPRAMPVVEQCLAIFSSVIWWTQGFNALDVAIQSGLLSAILICAQHTLSSAGARGICFLLRHVIGPATTYLESLLHIAQAYSVLSDTISNPIVVPASPHQSNIQVEWATFSTTLHRRLEIYHELQSDGPICQWACDNVLCSHIQPKSVFKRCSGCQEVLYCSTQCQRIDWQRGHRRYCALHFTENTTDLRLSFTSSERRFLRAVVHKDYEDKRSEISQTLVTRWAANPAAEVMTIFDYRASELSVSLHGISMTGNGQPGSHWPDLLARAAQSRGRLSLHVLMVPDGNGGRVVVAPLRSAASDVHDGLKMKGIDDLLQISDFVRNCHSEEVHCL